MKNLCNADYTLEEINSLEKLEVLRHEWRVLYSKCPWVTPFQAPEWVIPWWRYFGSNELMVLIVRNYKKKIVGIAPLFLYRHTSGRRIICFAGTGVTDYLDLITEPGEENLVIGACIEYLMSKRNRWDVCYFEQVKKESPLMRYRFPESLSTEKKVIGVCPVTELPGSIEHYFHDLPHMIRRNIKKAKRKIKDLDQLQLETANRNTVNEYLDSLFALHEARWEEFNQHGVLYKKDLQKFHREAASGFAETGELFLYRMAIAGKPVAIYYTLKKDERIYAYISGFDPSYKKMSPGVLSLFMLMENAIDKNIKYFDFLRGSEDYKYLWCAENTENFAITLYEKN